MKKQVRPEMNVTNEATIKIQIMGEVIEVAYIAKNTYEADKFMQYAPEIYSVIAEDKNSGLIFIVKNKSSR